MRLLQSISLYNATPGRSVENCKYIKQKLLEMIDTYVPSKTLNNHHHLPWMFVPLKHLIKKKQHVYNRAKLFQCESDWKEYKNLQSEVR